MKTEKTLAEKRLLKFAEYLHTISDYVVPQPSCPIRFINNAKGRTIITDTYWWPYLFSEFHEVFSEHFYWNHEEEMPMLINRDMEETFFFDLLEFFDLDLNPCLHLFCLDQQNIPKYGGMILEEGFTPREYARHIESYVESITKTDPNDKETT